MSFDALSWAWNLELDSPISKFILIAVAQYADQDGECFPSQITLSKKTGLAERAIRGHLAKLEDAGFIKREHRFRKDGTKTSDFITLNLDHRHVVPPAPNDHHHRHVVPVNSKKNSKYIKTLVTPARIEPETWVAFMEMRDKKKAVNSDKAIALLIAKLEVLCQSGDDPNKIIEQSIENSWKGLFQLKKERVFSNDRNADRANTIAVLTGRNRKPEKDVTPFAGELD